MPPIDPGGSPGSVSPIPPLKDMVPPQAMAHGGTIIRPGAVAWGGNRQVGGCEGIERALAAAAANPAELPGLLTELVSTRLWVPLPAGHTPVTDGAAVRLPLVGYQGTDFVPCFTSILRLTVWTELGETAESGDGTATEDSAPGGTERPGDIRAVPYIVVPAAGLASCLPSGIGLALNPDSVPGLPLYPECLPCLAQLAATGQPDPSVVNAWIDRNTSRLYSRD